MKGMRPLSLLTTLAVAIVVGCNAPGERPGDSTPTTIKWTLDVRAQQAVPFGARAFLDGEQVYLEPTAVQAAHRVEILRPYVPGEHLLEVEIVSSQEEGPLVYIASCTAITTTNGVHADGIPWTLVVGQRLMLRVSV